MIFKYIPNDVCSREMIFNIEKNIINDIQITGGCSGYSQGLIKLCIGQKIDYVIDKLKNIKCGYKKTSCPDQITKALLKYKENAK